MKLRLTRRLSYKLTKNTVLLALSLGLVLNLAQVFIDYLNENLILDEDVRALLNVTQSPASQIAFNIDAHLAEELLEGLLKHPAIIEATIADSDGRVLAKRARDPAASHFRQLSDFLFDPVRKFRTDLRVKQLDDIELGNLAVTVDTHYYGNAFIQRAAFTLLSGFVKSLALSFLLLFVFYIVLTQPLLRVIAAISKVNPDLPEKTRMPMPLHHDKDEIGVLVNSTNEHLASIDEKVQRLRDAENRLKNYTEHLEQIVDARTKEISEKHEQLQTTNQELIVAKEDAIKRAKARADFLANMSHEIRTPFNGVLGMISLAMEEPLTDKQKSELDVAYHSGVALLELLNDILDISKVEAGKLTLENIYFDLREVVEDASRLLILNAKDKCIELVNQIDPAFPERVMGDPTRVRQIITNLLGNAIKFTHEGSVTVTLRRDGTKVVIRVNDTGIGIAPAALERLFTPFYQANTDTVRRFGGTGLGLALCKQLVEQMGGSITASSQPGIGSCFSVILPLPIDPTVAAPLPPPLPPQSRIWCIGSSAQIALDQILTQLDHWGITCVRFSATEITASDLQEFNAKTDFAIIDPLIWNPLITPSLPADRRIFLEDPRGTLPIPLNASGRAGTLYLPVSRRDLLVLIRSWSGEVDVTERVAAPRTNDEPLRSLNVLVVEDNQINQMVARGILKKLGHKVTIAGDGREALELLAEQSFDIILMDCHMPVLDGYETTLVIRNENHDLDTPIIAITANAMEGDREKCLAVGMNDYITKPYDRERLDKTLRRWCSE